MGRTNVGDNFRAVSLFIRTFFFKPGVNKSCSCNDSTSWLNRVLCVYINKHSSKFKRKKKSGGYMLMQEKRILLQNIGKMLLGNKVNKLYSGSVFYYWFSVKSVFNLERHENATLTSTMWIHDMLCYF